MNGIVYSMRSSKSVSNMVPMDVDVVMPLWLLSSSLSPLPFQMLVMWPLFQLFGMVSSCHMVAISGYINSTIF